ncbi:hypothetical protein BGZ76_006020 [Entomortierella beljakovae]|nr:hypothetical protein BGZ76_006020 [Entomortierella beljakovae]
MTQSSASGKTRRLSLIRLFNGKTKSGSTIEPIESDAPTSPKYRHSMNVFQSQMLQERRKSLAAVADCSNRSASLDIKNPVEMNEKMRQFDELLQKRRGSTIRISLTPSLLQE